MVVLTLIVIVSLERRYIKSQQVTVTSSFLTVEDVFQKVNPTQQELAELKKTYTQQWQLAELSTWSNDELEVAKRYAYDFLATGKNQLKARRAVIEQYLLSINVSAILTADPTGAFKVPVDIDNALATGKLVVITPGTFKLSNPNNVLQVNNDIEAQVYSFKRFLENKSDLLWGTSSARSIAEQEVLRKLGYPAIPVAWGLSPHLFGRSITVAITDPRGSGGEYDRMLKGLNSAGLDKMRKCILDGQQSGNACYPTFQKLIAMGAITDIRYLELYEALSNNAYFNLFDLTGIYSLSIAEDGSYELGTVNPSFLLVAKSSQ